MDDPNIPSAGSPPPEAPYTPAGTAPPGATGTTIVIQSNMSLVIGLSMLVVGLIVGFLARPALLPTPATETVVVTQVVPFPVTVIAEVTQAAGAQNTPAVSIPVSPTPDLSAQKKQLMEVVVAQARHIKGNPDAKIIIVEFSDFQ